MRTLERILLRLGDHVFILRPLILVPAWSFYLLGAHEAARRGIPAHPAAFGTGLACLSAVLASAYLVNQVFDRDSDRINDKCHYVSRGLFQPRTLVLMALAAFLVAAALFRRTAPAQRGPMTLALVLSLAYSLPPVRLVGRPVLDLLANAVGYGGVAFVLGYASRGPAADAVAPAVPWMLLVGATFLHTTILDVAGDAEAAKTTTTVRFGVLPSARAAVWLAAAGLAAAAAAARSGGGLEAPVVLAASVPAFAAADRRIRRGAATSRWSAAVVQGATLAVAVAAGVHAPVYLAAVAGLALVARVYYRRRFGIVHPGPRRPAA